MLHVYDLGVFLRRANEPQLDTFVSVNKGLETDWLVFGRHGICRYDLPHDCHFVCVAEGLLTSLTAVRQGLHGIYPWCRRPMGMWKGSNKFLRSLKRLHVQTWAPDSPLMPEEGAAC